MSKLEDSKAPSAIAASYLRRAEWDTFDNELAYVRTYLELRNEFPEYNLTDLIMLSKIDRLYRRGLITAPVRDSLCEVYFLRKNVEREIECTKINSQAYDDCERNLDIIDGVLDSYDIVPVTMAELIDSTIKPSRYGKELREGPVLTKEQRSVLELAD